MRVGTADLLETLKIEAAKNHGSAAKSLRFLFHFAMNFARLRKNNAMPDGRTARRGRPLSCGRESSTETAAPVFLVMSPRIFVMSPAAEEIYSPQGTLNVEIQSG